MAVATERQRRDKQERWESIVDAAERVFFAKSVDAATMDEVAMEAAISKGLLYVYFKNKEDLYNAVCLRGLRLLRGRFEKVLRKQRNGIRQTRAIGLTYVAFARAHPDYFSSIVYQAAQETDGDQVPNAALCDRERDQIITLVAGAIRTGVEDGSIRADLDPMQTAIMLWGQMHGVIQIAILKNVQAHYHVDFERLIRFCFEFVTEALRPRP